MNSEYILRINTDKENYDILKDLLLVEPTSIKSFWEFSIKENSNLYPDAINFLLGLIEPKIKELNNNGIENEDISIWYLYEYEDQCNMEFQPTELKRLGDNGISLCISCWQK